MLLKTKYFNLWLNSTNKIVITSLILKIWDSKTHTHTQTQTELLLERPNPFIQKTLKKQFISILWRMSSSCHCDVVEMFVAYSCLQDGILQWKETLRNPERGVVSNTPQWQTEDNKFDVYFQELKIYQEYLVN